MTGYARSEGHDAQVSWVWEAKSVNGKGLELRIRVPSGHDSIEPYARESAARHLKRGNVQLGLNVSRIAEASAMRVNTVLLDQILAACAEGQIRHPGIVPPPWAARSSGGWRRPRPRMLIRTPSVLAAKAP